MQEREVIPVRHPLQLELDLPGSKSLANRALLLAALASGDSKLYGLPEAEDVHVMIEALRQLGVVFKRIKNGIEVKGRGGLFKSGPLHLSLGGSGTALRFLIPLMIFRQGETTISGNPSLSRRPVKPLLDALKPLGVKIQYLGRLGFVPFKMSCPAFKFKPLIKVRANQSSQFISALQMMVPLLPNTVTLKAEGKLVSQPYVTMTLKLMKSFGLQIPFSKKNIYKIKPQDYQPVEYEVEGDATAATYFTALHFLHGGRIKFKNLNLTSSWQGDIKFREKRRLLERHSDSELCEINMQDMPDAALTLVICAIFQNQTTKISGLSTLNFKESNRLKALEHELKKIGISIQAKSDSLTIKGLSFQAYQNLCRKMMVKSIRLNTYQDHRLAMCFAVLGTKIPGLIINNPLCVNKTYTQFWNDFEKIYQTSIPLKGRHLILTGMRGAGKTTWGKKWAKHLKRPFIDMDQEIEKEQGMSIANLVKKYGWQHFRKIEQKFCSEFNSKYVKPIILATGGGAVLSNENMGYLKKNGVSLFLFATPFSLKDRLKKDKRKRPRLTSRNLEEEVEWVWQKRRKRYLQSADYIWDTSEWNLKTQTNLEKLIN